MTQMTTLNNGIAMPQVGLGLWQASDSDTEEAVLTAIEAGYRLIDTAAIYGNEVAVGRALAKSPVPRNELFITTKLWNSDQGYESTLHAFDVSMKKLGLEYLDLYLIHWPVPAKNAYLETWRAFEKLYADGRIRAIGVSNFRIEDLDVLLQHAKVVPVLNQIELHPDFQQHELREYCEAHKIAVESWSPIGGSRSGNAILQHPLINELSTKYSKTPAQITLRWHLQNNLIVIPKSVHAERIKENYDIFDFELSDDDMQRLAELDANNRIGADPATMNVS